MTGPFLLGLIFGFVVGVIAATLAILWPPKRVADPVDRFGDSGTA